MEQMIEKFVSWQRKKYNPAKRAVLALGLSSVFILVEEKELVARFGKEYLEYKRKVPFLI